MSQYPYPYLYRSTAPYYHNLQSQTPQGTLSPQALHSPSNSMLSSLLPTSFYSTLTPASVISAAQKTSATGTILEPEISPEERKRQFQAGIKPLLVASQFTGAAAVHTLVSKIADYGWQDVDAATRLEILTKIRDGAGNHYFRAWSENTTAVEITRDWLKAAFVADTDSPLVETTMPLLHVSEPGTGNLVLYEDVN